MYFFFFGWWLTGKGFADEESAESKFSRQMTLIFLW